MSGISQQPLMGSNQSVQSFKMKTNFTARQPKSKSAISQQPIVRSYPNLKVKLLGSNQHLQRYLMKPPFNRRQQPTEDDLKYDLNISTTTGGYYLKLKLEQFGSNQVYRC
jgi:hypothetical protein